MLSYFGMIRLIELGDKQIIVEQTIRKYWTSGVYVLCIRVLLTFNIQCHFGVIHFSENWSIARKCVTIE